MKAMPLLLLLCACPAAPAQPSEPSESQKFLHESRVQYDARMQWWAEARFGLFIHWGLYAIPAGEWGTETNYGEWIRTSAEIPLPVYDTLVHHFNPVKFDANQWVHLAKEAGMKYIIITSKHHDGFCLFDSKQTDFDVMATPFKRDIMKELAAACAKEGMRIGWYHSIMDWHHPDYLPRREWEKDRSAAGADYDRYVQYMKSQLRELLTNYGEIGVLWFDGEWESTWNQQRGLDLYTYVRSLQPTIIINNRVGAGRAGMEGFTKEGEFAGDYATPEQEVPGTGIPGVYWETCMTMNDHWGYNKHDQNWKSDKELVRLLVDIASKGGNFLLNVGPTAEGLIPQPSVERLLTIGAWMKRHGESLYGTAPSPFTQLPWGRCTRKAMEDGTRLYLHVFSYPEDGRLVVPGLFNQATRAYLLSDAQQRPLPVSREDDALVLTVPKNQPDTLLSVFVLDVKGKPDVNNPPTIKAENQIFVDGMDVGVASEREGVEIRYTLDGSTPDIASPRFQGPVRITKTTTVTARCFRAGKPVSPPAQSTFRRVVPLPPAKVENLISGLRYGYYEGDWDRLPDFGSLSPVKAGVLPNVSLAPRREEERFGFEYTGYLRVPRDGVYVLSTESDDGSRLYIGEELVVDNDGLHGMSERSGAVALAAGVHPIRIMYFEKTGGNDLRVYLRSPGGQKKPLAETDLLTKGQ